MTLRSVFRSRGLAVGAALYLLFSLACTRLPLLDYLGYELAFVLALGGSIMSGLLSIAHTGSEYRSAPAEDAALRARRVGHAFLVSLSACLALLAIPLAVMLANAAYERNCSIVRGLEFFILLPVAGIAFSCSLGFFCAVHYRHPRAVYFLLFAATLAYVLVLGYCTPAIFSYNVFYGYFPGFTYDETMDVSGTLVLFRAFTLAAAGVLAWMATAVSRECAAAEGVRAKGKALAIRMVTGRRIYGTALGAAALVAVFWFRCDLGFESTDGSISRTLGGEFHTEHFTIVYAKGSYSEGEIRMLGAEHEFRLHQVMDALTLVHLPPITSFVYPSAEMKMKLMGAGNTDIAKPWRNEIHITRQSLHATLRHELVHVAAGRFGVPIIRASLSTGLVEGVAMAIDGSGGNRTLHQYAAGLRKFGLAVDIGPLMRITGFAAHTTAVSYVLAGSFCRYLIDRYGIRKLMLLYGSGDYRRLYGRTLEELGKDWQQFLDRIPVEDGDRGAIEALFSRPTIFTTTCARVIANRNRLARTRFAEGDYASSAALYRQSYEEGSGDEALAGWIGSEMREGHYRTPAQLVDTLEQTSSTPGRYLPLFLAAGDAWWGLNDITRARARFRRLAQADITDRMTEEALLHDEALSDTSHRSRILPCLLGGGTDSARLNGIDSLLQVDPLSRVLLQVKGEILQRCDSLDASLVALRSFAWGAGNPRLESVRLQMIGYGMFRERRFDDARVQFWLSLNYHDTPAVRMEMDDWIDRCDWMARHEF